MVVSWIPSLLLPSSLPPPPAFCSRSLSPSLARSLSLLSLQASGAERSLAGGWLRSARPPARPPVCLSARSPSLRLSPSPCPPARLPRLSLPSPPPPPLPLRASERASLTFAAHHPEPRAGGARARGTPGLVVFERRRSARRVGRAGPSPRAPTVRPPPARPPAAPALLAAPGKGRAVRYCEGRCSERVFRPLLGPLCGDGALRGGSAGSQGGCGWEWRGGV